LAGWVGCKNDQKKQGKRGYQIRGTALYCHDEENAIVLFFFCEEMRVCFLLYI
jgi:hypothetical protein